MLENRAVPFMAWIKGIDDRRKSSDVWIGRLSPIFANCTLQPNTMTDKHRFREKNGSNHSLFKYFSAPSE